MDFTLLGSDPRFLYLRERLAADGHRLTAENGVILAPPAEKRGVPYWRDPVYVIENAALTAEAAAELVMRRLPGTVRGADILIVGYGRIGSMLADRLGLKLINMRVVQAKHFQRQPDGAILLNDEGRKLFLNAWQERKRETITHPYLGEKLYWGLVPYVQALLLSRCLRGDLDGYPPFLWK